MRELLRWLLNLNGKDLDQATEELSKDTAKQRLKLVLIQDRLELAPEKLEDMKKEIWEVVSKYMVVDDDFMEFEVRRLDDLTVLVSNIEVKDLSELTLEPAT
ncbi:MAG: cell division topological specificity factor MinE [Chloroflexota bacterium]|jgi:cell division topological specificity factor|nr:cell division topological specificity factor MinE [Dehalococcoidia bacterium]MEC8911357.1 cell division topological specificity factor MinE [Chloroflexota bacterium]MCS5666710.1 cell division topological specificity factor MinE [Dehalococcoidia bacterium]MEC9272643.1 cell division topological specificity factor MinE [Chloroflexota bacterium]MEC9446730.1 cell division topological specificity factor MinE [Chloroflexota bacterium]|tara:strand:+ start:22 stop:327 length:306 start_codon:yes stop_codon:yes gene_type:complete